ncbi:FtsX-like permease family protein [Streptomyces cadmiisoli]|uniref:ABC transporter permease n=1 Tax=Streptomyces cadmiisoli TaxID=2184053 RepID=A0A2Z4ISJ4_9ACTN|nr:FtsX-like permease family protein [Streptomyces cadmiisoli]AWW35737.1 ABC transporter permease [Streptomyces cadmiisoli]
MLGLALTTLRARKGGFVGTFVALLLGSAVLSVCGILVESGLRSSQPPERYAAADVVVAGHQEARTSSRAERGKTPVPQPLVERVPVPTDVVEHLAAVEGVDTVVTDTGIPARVIGADGAVLSGANGEPPTGHNWSSTRMGPYRLVAGRAPAGDHQVVLDAGLAARAGVTAGDTVALMTGSRPERFRVAGVITLAGNETPRRSVVFFTDKLVERLAERAGSADALGVLAAPGTDTERLADAVVDALGERDLAVRTGDSRGEAEFLDVASTGSTLVLLASAVAGNVLLVMVLVVAGTVSLSVAHRRRETALLRAVGATPRQVRRMVAAETLLVALLGGALGWPLGIAMIRWIRDRLAGHGFVPPDFEPVIGPLPALGAVATAVLTAHTAALVAARRANRIRPTEALGDAAMERTGLGRGRLITGSVLVVGAAGIFVAGLANGGDFTVLVGLANSLVLVVVIAAAVLGPLLSRLSMGLLGPLLSAFGVTGQLAAANSAARPRLLAAAATPLVLAVSFAATVVFAQTTAQHAAQKQLRDGMSADHVLTAAGGLAPDVVRDVRRLHHVSAATAVVKSTVVASPGAGDGHELVSLSVQGVDPKHLTGTMDLKPYKGDMKRLDRTTVALSTVASSWLGRGPGDTVRLRLGDGTPISPTVVAVYERGTGFADVTVDHDLLLAHTTSRWDTSVLVRAAPGTNGVAAALSEVARHYPGTVVQDRLDVGDQMRRQQANAWVNYLLAGLILLYAGVTVANTQAMNTSTRRREFGLLRLGGTTRTQVMRMMRWESLAVVLTGVGLGTLASVPALVLVSLALTGSVWPTVPPLAYLAIAGGVAALAVVAALVPARLLLRTSPVEAVGARE